MLESMWAGRLRKSIAVISFLASISVWGQIKVSTITDDSTLPL